MTDDRIWRYFRLTRHDPPELAGSGSRRQVYASSLEQAEELFRASAAVSPSVRPLTLFYGLSQMGRAISAATEPAQDWRLSGHGIKANNLQGNFSDIEVWDAGAGAFTQLARTLKSDSLTDPVRLRDIFSSLPESLEHRLPEDKFLPPLYFYLEDSGLLPRIPLRGVDMRNIVSARVYGFPEDLLDPSLAKVAAFEKFKSRYPSIYGCDIHEYVSPSDRGGMPPGAAYRIYWQIENGKTADETSAAIKERAPLYRADGEGRWALATLTSGVDVQPLLRWWAVLYGLSMLARYEPNRWVALLDVNRTGYAVPLELMLDAAVRTVPSIGYRVLCDLAR